MPNPTYKKNQKKEKMYKDYLEEYEKQCREKGQEPVKDRMDDYFYKKI